MSEISLSTMWTKNNYEHIKDFIADVHRWGFTGIELTPALSKEGLDELLRVSDLKIYSIHAPCSPVSLSDRASPDNPPISSLDKEERQKAIHYVESTIEFASQFGVKAVVLHAGFLPSGPRVDFAEGASQLSMVDLNSLKQELYRLYNTGSAKSKEYVNVKQRLEQERRVRSGPYFEAVKMSLDRLANFAFKHRIKLGIETRDSFHEIPQFAEMENILDEFQGSPIGYWHDIGHAEKTSRLGITPHADWLSRFKERMIGVHLHDVKGLQDHYLPGMGNLDWDFVAEYLPKGIIMVCEIGEWNDRTKIDGVVPFLRGKRILT